MPNFLASYDLKSTSPSPYAAMKEHLAKHRFYKWLHPESGKWPHLPNTTSAGVFNNMNEAVSAFRQARADAAAAIGGTVAVEKVVIVEYTTFFIDTDEDSDD